jgi:DNA invertase Pin-like site-specific DNA recombinase
MDTTRVITYARVSTDEQEDGLTDQREKLAKEVLHREWTLVGEPVEDRGESGKDLDRPGIQRVLARLAAGEGDVLLVTKLDRLTRSTRDLAEILYWSDRLGVRILIIDSGIDTGNGTGRMLAGIMAQVAEWERGIISERTKSAASVRREAGRKMGHDGVRDTNPALAKRIKAMRDGGASYRAIADALNADGIPTVLGGTKWRVSSVQSSCGYVRPPAPPKRIALPVGTRKRARRVAT